MKHEFELVKPSQLNDVHLFFVDMSYRNSHIHKELEICLVLSGRVEVYSQKESYQFEKDTIMLFNPRQPHEIHSLGEEALFLALQISPKFCSRFFPSITNLEFDNISVSSYLSENDIKDLRNKLLELSLYYFQESEFYEFKCYSIINNICYKMLSFLPHHYISDEEKNAKANISRRLSRILSYIEEHFTERILLSDIAEREDLSVSYLSHFFKDNLNISFQDYVSILRYQKARILVEQTDMRLTDISITCGFSDYRYFNKIYKEQLGFTPKEYRSKRNFKSNKPSLDVTDTKQEFFSEKESLELTKKIIGNPQE